MINKHPVWSAVKIPEQNTKASVKAKLFIVIWRPRERGVTVRVTRDLKAGIYDGAKESKKCGLLQSCCAGFERNAKAAAEREAVWSRAVTVYVTAHVTRDAREPAGAMKVNI